MKRTLAPDDITSHLDRLAEVNAQWAAHYPGDSGDRQPVHTVYGGAQLFKAGTARKLGELALRAVDQHAPDADTLADAVGLDADLADRVYARVLEKLRREAVEDFRIDFEDGFGIRPDDEEDATAVRAATEVANGMAEGILPPFLGIRIKMFSEELKHRAIRTLDLFLTTLIAQSGRLPDNFVVTLPKVTNPEEVAVLVDLFELLEPRLGLPAGSLKLEIMVETPQSIVAHDGTIAVPGLVRAGRGRCVAAHFGTYDYTAGCNITAAWQRMGHPSCDFARHMQQVSLRGTGVWISDGATNIMPVGDTASVHRAWKLHYDDVMHSLEHAYYQGWDLHPAQLVTRYAAVYTFFLRELAGGQERLKNFVDQATKATLVGDVFDDAATGQGLLNTFLRGYNCGAITADEVTATGLTLDEIHGRSFVKIMQARRASE